VARCAVAVTGYAQGIREKQGFQASRAVHAAAEKLIYEEVLPQNDKLSGGEKATDKRS
jgi:hypothetical protein